MLKRLRTVGTVASVWIVVTLAASGCTEEEQGLPPNVDNAVVTPVPTRIELGQASWEDGRARSLPVLLEWQPNAVVGVVRSAIPGVSTISVSPPASQIPGLRPRYRTRYDVELTRIVSSDSLSVGETLNLGTTGAVISGVEYSHQDDPLMRVGEQYLFFLLYDDEGGWGTGPFGRMRLDPAQRLVPVADRWSSLPAVMELTCLTVSAAEPLIVAAASESPPLLGAPWSTPATSPRLTCNQ